MYELTCWLSSWTDCHELGTVPVESSTTIFAKLTDSMNDHCNLCSSFKNATDSDKVKAKEKKKSSKNKVSARENKQKDKKIRTELL